jgi:putative redox protein
VLAGREQAVSREMSLTATARAIPGTLRQEVVIDGQHRLITDEPQRLGGEGSGPAPHELFPAALAACVSTTLVMYARTKAGSWAM